MGGSCGNCELKILAFGSTGSNGMLSSVMLITLNVTPMLLHLIFQRHDKFYFLNTSAINNIDAT